MRGVRGAIRVLALSAVVASAALAQRAPSTRLPTTAPRMCSMLFSVLFVQLVDSAHAPLPGAAVTVRRVRTGAIIEGAGPMDDGSYRILEDGKLKDLHRSGEAFDAIFIKGGRSRRVRLRIGMDADGCHVRFTTVPKPIVF